MTTRERKDSPDDPSSREAPQAEPRNRETELRRQRLAAALRDNLKRRKAQARTRSEPGES